MSVRVGVLFLDWHAMCVCFPKSERHAQLYLGYSQVPVTAEAMSASSTMQSSSFNCLSITQSDTRVRCYTLLLLHTAWHLTYDGFAHNELKTFWDGSLVRYMNLQPSGGGHLIWSGSNLKPCLFTVAGAHCTVWFSALVCPASVSHTQLSGLI